MPIMRRITQDECRVPLPKDRPARSEEYRRLVAALPCAYCKRTGYSQAAHPNGLSAGKGRGIKADDRLCFPLCCDGYAKDARGCHWLFDNYRLIERAHRDEWAAQMAAQTRAKIERDGKWPKRLAKWDGK